MTRDLSSVKVRHLSTVHNIGDTRIVHKELKSLQEAGFDVALIACHDGDTSVAGVPVLGIGEATGGRGYRMSVKALQLFRRALRERADIYHFHDPELMPVGIALRLLGKKVIYDVHEDVPKQILHKFWISPLIRRPIAFLARTAEALTASLVNGVVSATPSIAEKFPRHKTIVCQNFPEKGLALERNTKPFSERRSAFIYIGGLTAHQGITEMVTAFAELPDEVTGLFAGVFDEDPAPIEAMPGWAHVNYVGRLTRPEVVDALRDSQVGIVIDHPITNYVDAYSTKMFEYMACGIPFVASDFPLWVGIVDDASCGTTVDPYDTKAVASAISAYLDDPELAAATGERGRQAILNKFNWSIEFEKLLQHYKGLI